MQLSAHKFPNVHVASPSRSNNCYWLDQPAEPHFFGPARRDAAYGPVLPAFFEIYKNVRCNYPMD
jgi:hypothetical protein